MLLRLRKGQNTLEYALLIAAVVAGVIAMQYYVKRGFQGKVKDSSDQIGEQFHPGQVKASWYSVNKSATKDIVGLAKDDTGVLETGAEQGKTISRMIKMDAGGVPYSGTENQRFGSESVTAVGTGTDTEPYKD